MSYLLVNTSGRILQWLSSDSDVAGGAGTSVIHDPGASRQDARESYYDGVMVSPKHPSTVTASSGPWVPGDSVTISGIPTDTLIQVSAPDGAEQHETSGPDFVLPLPTQGDYRIIVNPVRQLPFETLITVQ